MMSETSSETIANLCKILLDEDRLMILGLLAAQPRRADELVALLPPDSSAAAKLGRHIQQLQEVGIVTYLNTPDDAFRLDVAYLQLLKRQLFSREDASKALSPDEKVLAAFIKHDQLVQLPTHPVKLQLVLAWLVEKFEAGVDYPERAVNDRLMGHEIDHVTLRRLLIDHLLLTREAGVYRRVEGA